MSIIQSYTPPAATQVNVSWLDSSSYVPPTGDFVNNSWLGNYVSSAGNNVNFSWSNASVYNTGPTGNSVNFNQWNNGYFPPNYTSILFNWSSTSDGRISLSVYTPPAGNQIYATFVGQTAYSPQSGSNLQSIWTGYTPPAFAQVNALWSIVSDTLAGRMSSAPYAIPSSIVITWSENPTYVPVSGSNVQLNWKGYTPPPYNAVNTLGLWKNGYLPPTSTTVNFKWAGDIVTKKPTAIVFR